MLRLYSSHPIRSLIYVIGTFDCFHKYKILERRNKLIPHCNVHRELRGCLEVPPTLK